MTTKQIKDLLTSELNKNTADLAEFNLLVKAAELNKWEINKKILKHLPDGCDYKNQFGMYNVVFPSGNSHLLGWERSTAILSLESLKHSDSWASNGSESRIAQLNSILQPENFINFCKLFINLHKAVKAVNDAINSIKENKQEAFYNPAYYDLLRMAGITSKALNELDDVKKGKNS